LRGWNLGQWFRPTSGDTEGRGKRCSKDENNSPTCIHLDLIITKQTVRETEFFRNLLNPVPTVERLGSMTALSGL